MPKFFIKTENLKENKEIWITGSDVNHIKNVLRKKIDDKINICNSDTQKNYECVIKNIEENNGPVIELPSQIESNNILVYNNYIGILNKSILSVYSTNGKKEKELEVEISNCIYDTENRFLALAENEGSKLELISGTDVLWKKDIEGNIEHIFINHICK